MKTNLRRLFRRGVAGARTFTAFVALTLVLSLASPGLSALAAEAETPVPPGTTEVADAPDGVADPVDRKSVV